jgi:hypothetical protein
MGVDTRQLLLGLDTPILDPGTLLLDPGTLLLDPDTLLPTLTHHQAASMEGLLHTLQPTTMHHTSMEIIPLLNSLLNSQEHLEDMVTAAGGGRDPSAYFENVGMYDPKISISRMYS